MKITFGVELECLIPRSYIGDDSQFNPGGHGRGNQISNAPAGWTVERDGSVRSTVDGMSGVEVVSPILEGEDGLIQVVAMCDYLTEIGATVNSLCGLHVHVGAKRLNVEAYAKAFVVYEKAFFASGGEKAKGRFDGTWCKPSSRWDGGRYASVNLTNVGRSSKNTVEIRCFSPSLDAGDVIGATLMATSLVMAVRNGTTITGTAFETGREAMVEYVKIMADPANQIVAIDDTDLSYLVEKASQSAV